MDERDIERLIREARRGVRVVLDTNVLISAFVFPGGDPEAVYRLAIEGRVDLITSRPLLVEFARMLTSKFGWAAEPARGATAHVARIGRVVESTCAIHSGVHPPFVRHPSKGVNAAIDECQI